VIEVDGDALPVSQLRLEHFLKLIELRLNCSAVFIFLECRHMLVTQFNECA